MMILKRNLRHHGFLILFCIFLPLVLGWVGVRSGVDFPVYYRATQNFFHHRGPVYGPRSGLGWPMYFRYPPLFLFIFGPLRKLPYDWSAGIWAAGKALLLLWLIRRFWLVWGPGQMTPCEKEGSTLPAAQPRPARLLHYWRLILIPLLLCATYFLVELRYGNVQFYIFGLTAAALLLLAQRRRRWPWLSAFFLGLAIAIKVWPLFFLPFLWLRGARKQALGALLFTALLTLLPGLFWSWHGNWLLLRQWFWQEWGTASRVGMLWYPSQALRGMLTRYLTTAHIPGYPKVGLAHWPAARVRLLWLAMEACAYAGWLWLAARKRAAAHWNHAGNGIINPRQEMLIAAIGWSLLPLLAPFTHVEDLCVLLWPAWVAGAWLQWDLPPSRSRRLIWTAALLAGFLPLVPGHAAQRWLQAAGADFWVTLLLCAGLLAAWGEFQARAANCKNSAITSIPR